MITSEVEFSEGMNPDFFHHHFRSKPELWRDQAIALSKQAGLRAASFRAFSDGVNLVAAIDEAWVLKIFPPFLLHQWQSETQALLALHDHKLSVQIPRLHSKGILPHQWAYVIMSLVPGVILESAWQGFDQQDRGELLHKIGQIMREVHALPLGHQLSLSPLWEPFLEKQVSQCYARHRNLGMPTWFLQELPHFLQHDLILPQARSPVLLTGEYTPFNLLVESQAKPEITSMIDFADSMIDPAEYDLLGPMLFLAAGDSTLIERLLRAYDGTDAKLTKDRRRCLMSLQILHRYSNFFEQLRLPWVDSVSSIRELEELIWPL